MENNKQTHTNAMDNDFKPYAEAMEMLNAGTKKGTKTRKGLVEILIDLLHEEITTVDDLKILIAGKEMQSWRFDVDEHGVTLWITPKEEAQ